MDIKTEISKYSSPKNKPILLWLFKKYHRKFQWNFLAYCKFKHYGKLSYQTNRIWEPKPEGIILYKHKGELYSEKCNLLLRELLNFN